jgi:hypothetical protein
VSLNRHAKKRDDNEGGPCALWRAAGAYVEQLGGAGLPDCLVHHQGRMYRAEVKGAKRGLTPAQVEAFTRALRAGVPTYVVRSEEHARQLLADQLAPWAPEEGAVAGAARAIREHRPGHSRARTVAELCAEAFCLTSCATGSRRCAAHSQGATGL